MKRLDIYLAEKGLARSRSQAAQLIKKGAVRLLGPKGESKVIKQVSFDISACLDWKIEVDASPFVSRAGEKLEGALRRLSLDPKGWRCLDIGQSTGGFTDCLLKAGALSVIGLDVGQKQLDPALEEDPRVQCLEKFNARELKERSAEVLQLNQSHAFDLVVMDASFISMTLLLPGVASVLKPGGYFLGLVKPQFEVGPEGLGKGGIVRDDALFSEVKAKTCMACEKQGLAVEDYFESSLSGTDGNREFFVFSQVN